jgi:hypothetical protein
MPNFELSLTVYENPDKQSSWNIRTTSAPLVPMRCEMKGDHFMCYKCVASFESKEAATAAWSPLLQAFETEPNHVG